MSDQNEQIDYHLIPVEENPDAWAVRIGSGQFIETVIMYGAVAFNQVKDHMTFNFEVVSSPNDFATIENEDLQMIAADILSHIIAEGIKDGSVQFKDRNAN